jgi:hypothetical protein
MRAAISLIADLNSLQGRKKFPVRMRRELAHNALIYCPFFATIARSYDVQSRAALSVRCLGGPDLRPLVSKRKRSSRCVA